MEKITRIGVYGIAMQDDKILLITQKKGPYAGKFDFPGGGIEFGETPEETLSREFIEEVNMTFSSLQLYDNLTTMTNVPQHKDRAPFTFFHIGMIYNVFDVKTLSHSTQNELLFQWTEINTLKKEQCSSTLWKYVQNL